MKKKLKVKKISRKVQAIYDIIAAYEDWESELTDRQYNKLEKYKFDYNTGVVDELLCIAELFEC